LPDKEDLLYNSVYEDVITQRGYWMMIVLHGWIAEESWQYIMEGCGAP
jgi:hypothetical protein